MGSARTVRPPVELVPAEKLLAHEQVEEEAVGRLAHTMVGEGAVRSPIVADRATCVVLDGHHRLAALRSLGVRRVPVCFVDYHESGITVSSWKPGVAPPTKEQVLERGLKREPLPPKTTRHAFPWVLADARILLATLFE